MANNSYVINGQITFNGSLSGQVALSAQPIGGGLLLLLPNGTGLAQGGLLSAIAVNGNTVTLGFVPPSSSSVSTGQLSSVEGNGSKVQLTNGSAAPSPVTTALGTAAGYTILGASAVTNSDGSSTVINGGNIGSYPTNTITPGTPAWTLSGGAAVVTAVAQNQTDLEAAIVAYNLMGPGTVIGVALDSQVLAPGVYSAGTFTLSGGTLTLNGAGTYVFLASTTITLTGASQIVLTNGATAANVVFVCGTFTAAANSGTLFNGNILAATAITVDGGIYNGRLLAHTAAITISTATVINAPVQSGVVAAGDVVIYDANGNVMSSGILLSSLGGAAGVTSVNGLSGAVTLTAASVSAEPTSNWRSVEYVVGTPVNNATLGGPYTVNFGTAFADNSYAVEATAVLGEALATASCEIGGVVLQAGGVGVTVWVMNHDSVPHNVTIHVMARHN